MGNINILITIYPNILNSFLRQSLSQTKSYNTLAINLKLFAQFAHFRDYFFKTQISQT